MDVKGYNFGYTHGHGSLSAASVVCAAMPMFFGDEANYLFVGGRMEMIDGGCGDIRDCYLRRKNGQAVNTGYRYDQTCEMTDRTDHQPPDSLKDGLRTHR